MQYTYSKQSIGTAMNIDKFGHHVHKRLRLSEHIDIYNDTLQKSETGEYDLKSSKLKGLSSPDKDDEAVNKAYLDKTVQELRNEISQVNSRVLIYLKNLESARTDRLSSMFYSKIEIDRMIQAKQK